MCHFANGLTGGPRGLPAIPHYPLKRLCLEQASVADCLALLNPRRGPPALTSAGNMVLADGAGRVADVELRPDEAAEVGPNAGLRTLSSRNGCRLHTNHYLHPRFAHHPTLVPDSAARLERLEGLVGGQWGALTVDAMKVSHLGR